VAVWARSTYKERVPVLSEQVCRLSLEDLVVIIVRLVVLTLGRALDGLEVDLHRPIPVLNLALTVGLKVMRQRREV
jgi:hypothetical protein